MVELIQILDQAVYQMARPAKIKPVSYCGQPSPYITEEHCPPKRAPEIPRREY